MKQTVLQQEIERQEKLLNRPSVIREGCTCDGCEKARLDLKFSAQVIGILTALLPASEQELKEAYQARIDMTVSGDYVSADDWFRNEFGAG